MTLSSEFAYRAATPADQKAIRELDAWAFPNDLSPATLCAQPFPLDFDRTGLVVRENAELGGGQVGGGHLDDEQVVGVHSSFEFRKYPVPGTEIPVSGLTWVGVHPQFRRRGILRAMIEQHLADCVARGESVSALFAAEPTIYGRFGYGPASQDVRVTIPRGAQLKPARGSEDLTVRIETRSAQDHQDLINSIHAAARRDVGGTGLNRPGWVGRDTQGLQQTWHNDHDPVGGREPERIVTVRDENTPVGYATLRRSVEWKPTGPHGRVTVTEAVALTPAATHRLWTTLLNLDLTTEIHPFLMATDDPLLSLLENNREIDQTIVDNTWVRIIDLPVALASRQYAADVDVVLEVSDSLLVGNNGRWHLRAFAFGGACGTQTATVERTDRPAEITLDIKELATVYLGAGSLASLSAAGLVTATDPRVLGMASAGFNWPHAPVSNWVF